MDQALAAVTDAYRRDRRGHGDGRPWVMLNMIASIDGAVAIDGVSGGLGNDADFAVFKTLRSLADVVLVAAGTARAEGYRPPRPEPEAVAERRARGQQPRPIVAVVTRSLRLDLDAGLFADPSYRPVVVTVEAADPDRLVAARQVARVVVAGEHDVDLAAALHELAETVGPIVLAEGGPTLNAQLAATDLLDEVCVTVSPLLVGGGGGRMLAGGPAHEPRVFAIDRALPAGGMLFTRYLRRR